MKITPLQMPVTVEALDTIREDLPEGVEIHELMTGLKTWRNPLNKFFVIRLHRTVDPKKRTQEWIEKTKRGLTHDEWMREYELRWESVKGRAVFLDEWSEEFHTSRKPLGWSPALPVCRGWDFGLYPACCFVQLLPHGRLLIMREAVGVDIDTERFIVEVDRLSNEWFPGATFFEFIDPTGTNRAGTDGRTYAGLLASRPLRARRIIRGANAPAQRRTAVVDFLKDTVKGQPCLIVDPSCEYIIKGFSGGYVYPRKNNVTMDRPEKNIFSHIHDALQYVCSKVRTANLKLDPNAKIRVQEPSYGQRRPSTNYQSQVNVARPTAVGSVVVTYGGVTEHGTGSNSYRQNS